VLSIEILLSGMTAGSVYALVAVGFNVLYRPTNVFNFAQGDFVMLGAMIGASALGTHRLPWLVGVPLAAGAVGLLGLVEERVAVAPILRRSGTGASWIISTLAYSLIIANLVGHVWGPDPIKVRPPSPLSLETFEVAGLRVSSYQVALIVGTVLIVLAIERCYRTRAGKAIMAVAEDRDAALLRGIDPERLGRWSFFLGCAFAALTGVLAAPLLYASTALGPLLLIKGFEAAAVGGIGDNRGALVAGYLLGVAEAIGAVLLSPAYQLASTFVLLLAILLIRPQGLFGHAEARRV
jgi:branched-chain amino acid transport system permease protein